MKQQVKNIVLSYTTRIIKPKDCQTFNITSKQLKMAETENCK